MQTSERTATGEVWPVVFSFTFFTFGIRSEFKDWRHKICHEFAMQKLLQQVVCNRHAASAQHQFTTFVSFNSPRRNNYFCTRFPHHIGCVFDPKLSSFSFHSSFGLVVTYRGVGEQIFFIYFVNRRHLQRCTILLWRAFAEE